MSKKPGGKPRRQAAKLDPQSPKPDHAPDLSLKPAKPPEVESTIGATVVAAAATAPPAFVAAAPAVAVPVAVASPAFPARGTAAANTPSIDFQTIAMAYGDYTRKSFEQTRSFVEKLAGVRSLDKAIEIQTEFARQAYETFVQESQRICDLYSGLARQTIEGAVVRAMPAAR